MARSLASNVICGFYNVADKMLLYFQVLVNCKPCLSQPWTKSSWPTDLKQENPTMRNSELSLHFVSVCKFVFLMYISNTYCALCNFCSTASYQCI